MKCYAVFSSGRELDIDKGTYVELIRRIDNGRTKGWYRIKHGPSIGCTLNIESLSSVEMVLTDKERKALEAEQEAGRKERIAKVRNEEKYTGKRMEGSFTHDPQTCPIYHGNFKEANIEPRYYMTDQDIKCYVPICTMCGWIGNLVKPAAVKNTFGIEPDDIKLLDDNVEKDES